MDYDALCAGLRNMELNTCREAADAIVQLQADLAAAGDALHEIRNERETALHEMQDQLAAETQVVTVVQAERNAALDDLAAARALLKDSRDLLWHDAHAFKHRKDCAGCQLEDRIDFALAGKDAK
jgi:ElaB/YqjD/DUF883 family membrane-anchored ribosome-binding protein